VGEDHPHLPLAHGDELFGIDGDAANLLDVPGDRRNPHRGVRLYGVVSDGGGTLIRTGVP